jgi:hypothetical protein
MTPKIAGTANFYSLVCWTWYSAASGCAPPLDSLMMVPEIFVRSLDSNQLSTGRFSYTPAVSLGNAQQLFWQYCMYSYVPHNSDKYAHSKTYFLGLGKRSAWLAECRQFARSQSTDRLGQCRVSTVDVLTVDEPLGPLLSVDARCLRLNTRCLRLDTRRLRLDTRCLRPEARHDSDPNYIGSFK